LEPEVVRVSADRGKTVLLVGNSSLARFRVRNALEAWGLAVIEVRQAAEMRLLDRDELAGVGLVILDLNSTQEEASLMTLRSWQNEFPVDLAPVLVLSAVASREFLREVLACGAVACLRKPFAPPDLKERVEAILGPLTSSPSQSQSQSQLQSEPSPPHGIAQAGPAAADVEKEVRKEIKRAQRGKTPLALLQIRWPKAGAEETAMVQEIVQKSLRETDMPAGGQRATVASFALCCPGWSGSGKGQAKAGFG
jgi:DNA-binding response OmpR family regulator